MPGHPKLRIEIVRKYFEDRDCKLLTKEYMSNKSPLEYICKCGKTCKTCWNNFSRGFSCKFCYLGRFEEVRKKRETMLKLRDKLYTLSDVARMYESNPAEFWNAVYVKKIIPPPGKQVGDRPRKYYTEKDVVAIGKLIETSKKE